MNKKQQERVGVDINTEILHRSIYAVKTKHGKVDEMDAFSIHIS